MGRAYYKLSTLDLKVIIEDKLEEYENMDGLEDLCSEDPTLKKDLSKVEFD